MSDPSQNCARNCSSCGENCPSRDPKSMQIQGNPESRVKKVIAVMSGKGGVGKSLVSALIASELNKQGLKTGILDADITGPSIPMAFNIHERPLGNDVGILPPESEGGVKVMSINLLLKSETDPVAWRGPIIAGTVKQFWTEVSWGDIDVLVVDMPPGTGDVPLTVFQSLPVDGVVIVTSPQDLVSMIVTKAVNFAGMMKLPIIGIVENMSYLVCPDCGKKIHLFGESHIEEVARSLGVKVLDRIPIDPEIATAVDQGRVESLKEGLAAGAAEAVKAL